MARLQFLPIARFFCLLLLLPQPAASGSAISDCQAAVGLDEADVEINTASGTRRFRVEIADTAQARQTGLMCRDSLAADHGMLFVYPIPKLARMWMKDTRIPLDILFVAADGRIVKIADRVPAGGERRVASGVPVSSVLELPAGTAAQHGIRVDDRLSRVPASPP